jgi:acyl-CoA hydrolase
MKTWQSRRQIVEGRHQPMSATVTSDRFTTLPDEQTLAATVVALEEHGFSVEVVDDLAAARQAVLARIPRGSSVMTNTSVTLQETGIADAINDGGPFDSARNKMLALDFATQAQQMKSIGGQPDYALGSVHAVTRDGTLVIASASGSQLASYAWGAANVIFVVGAQKLVPSVDAARERIYQHSLVLEDARAQAAYGQHSAVGKILEIHQELPGRIHVVLIRQSVGF